VAPEGLNLSGYPALVCSVADIVSPVYSNPIILPVYMRVNGTSYVAWMATELNASFSKLENMSTDCCNSALERLYTLS